MTPEAEARLKIDERLIQAGWVVQSIKQLNLSAGLGVAVREFPTDTGPVDYALFVDGVPVGVIEAKPDDAGEHITVIETQSGRYANSKFKRLCNKTKDPTTFSTIFALLTDKNPLCCPSLFTRLIPVR